MSAANLPGVGTPQFRTLLIRKLRAVFPSCSVRIVYPERGIAFQLFDIAGRPRSALVNIYRMRADLLTKTSLERIVRTGGEPKARFPVEMLN